MDVESRVETKADADWLVSLLLKIEVGRLPKLVDPPVKLSVGWMEAKASDLRRWESSESRMLSGR